MSCIIHNNILDINLIQVSYLYIKVSNKIIIPNNIWNINPFSIFFFFIKSK
jgi:hypothetical protein